MINDTAIILISIHTFLAEGDETGLAMTAKTIIFQSTPSLRKVTCESADVSCSATISIHTFLAEGDDATFNGDLVIGISIHTFLAEGDESINSFFNVSFYFNPHLPCGR